MKLNSSMPVLTQIAALLIAVTMLTACGLAENSNAPAIPMKSNTPNTSNSANTVTTPNTRNIPNTPNTPNISNVPNTPNAPNASMSAAAARRSDEEWRKILTPEQFRVLRQAGTERAYGPAYEVFKQEGAGAYVCAGCGAELFSSKEKFDSHCGWPSFYDPANAKNVKTRDDYTLGTVRTEVTCARCDGHLGHVFKGEGFKTPTDTRFCINGVSLKFVPAKPAP